MPRGYYEANGNVTKTGKPKPRTQRGIANLATKPGKTTKVKPGKKKAKRKTSRSK